MPSPQCRRHHHHHHRCSDNVVRAGLTPKFKDVPTLTSMLTYASGAPAVDAGAPVDGYTTLYTPPVPEFQLQRVALPAGVAGGGYTLPPVAGAAVVVVVSGAATARCQSCPGGEAATVALSEGQVWLQPADVGVTLTTADGGNGVLLFRSHPNPAAIAHKQ
jgi:mannose-6-phosphate isomerase